MSARKSKPGADLPDVERQANRLLRALAEPGASAKPTDIPRPGLLAITGKRKGISLAAAHFPASAGAHLVAQDLARWGEAGNRPVLESPGPAAPSSGVPPRRRSSNSRPSIARSKMPSSRRTGR